MVALQETKLFSPTFHLFHSIGGVRITEWVVLDSIDASGGQLIGRNDTLFRKSVNFN